MKGHNQSDRELLAFDFLAEVSNELLWIVLALNGSARLADKAATEAYLWSIRRALLTMIESWREVVPGPDDKGGAHG